MVRANKLEPSETPLIVELVSEAFPILVSVLDAPLMVLFVRVCEAAKVTTWSEPTWTCPVPLGVKVMFPFAPSYKRIMP